MEEGKLVEIINLLNNLSERIINLEQNYPNNSFDSINDDANTDIVLDDNDINQFGKAISITNQLNNWATVPKTLHRKLSDVFGSIYSRSADSELRQELNAIKSETENKIKHAITKHLTKQREEIAEHFTNKDINLNYMSHAQHRKLVEQPKRRLKNKMRETEMVKIFNQTTEYMLGHYYDKQKQDSYSNSSNLRGNQSQPPTAKKSTDLIENSNPKILQQHPPVPQQTAIGAKQPVSCPNQANNSARGNKQQTPGQKAEPANAHHKKNTPGHQNQTATTNSQHQPSTNNPSRTTKPNEKSATQQAQHG